MPPLNRLGGSLIFIKKSKSDFFGNAYFSKKSDAENPNFFRARFARILRVHVFNSFFKTCVSTVQSHLYIPHNCTNPESHKSPG